MPKFTMKILSANKIIDFFTQEVKEKEPPAGSLHVPAATGHECSGCGRKYNSDNEAIDCLKTHDCCANKKDKKKGFINGIIYGLVPHTFCILFIIGAVLGVTLFTSAFKPFLMNKNFFYILLGLSFGFASLSALFYLKRNNCLCFSGMGKRWKFLSILYTTTIAVNILFFFVIFPAVANIGFASASTDSNADYSSIILNVAIPCSGHAPLIISELEKLPGVKDVKYNGDFIVYYDSSVTDKDKITSIDIFKEYPAKVLSESQSSAPAPLNSGTSAGGCCGGGSGGCGGGSCGCGGK